MLMKMIFNFYRFYRIILPLYHIFISLIHIFLIFFREGRAALTTGFHVFKFVTIACLLTLFVHLILYGEGKFFTKTQYLVTFSFTIFLMAISSAYCGPEAVLGPKKSIRGMADSGVLFSLIGQVIILFLF